MPRKPRPPRPALTAASLLQLIWLASPALPVGGFSYSEALETAVESGLVTNEAQAAAWLQDQLLLSLARSELAVLSTCNRVVIYVARPEAAARDSAPSAPSIGNAITSVGPGRSIHCWCRAAIAPSSVV